MVVAGCLWRAPELLRYEGIDETKEADIYSLAMIILEVVTRDTPFAKELLSMPVDGRWSLIACFPYYSQRQKIVCLSFPK